MNIDRAGIPFIAAPLVAAAALATTRRRWLAAPLAGVAAFMTFFFRDPERRVPAEADAVVSPADGRVVVAGAPQPGVAPPGDWQQISIFLSPLDVHVNRTPVGGVVTRVEYRPGRFLPAYRPEAARDNEQNEIWIDRHGDVVVVRQVVGILARRVVCRVAEGDVLRAGDRFGLMKFGSRMDVFLPVSATLCVRPGDVVRGGESILARLPVPPWPRPSGEGPGSW
jgi:phosphatidylserine decarboxylase